MVREGVLIEWTDANRVEHAFSRALRAKCFASQLNTRIHPMGEICVSTHRPARRSRMGRDVYRHAVTAVPERSRTMARPNPQRLDTLVGKILRIIPDMSEHVATST